VDQTFNARSDFDECTIVSHNDYFTFHVVAYLQVRIQCIPWVWSQLLQAKSDTFLFVVEVQDNYVQFLIQLNHFARIAYTAPRQVGDVNQTVYAAQVDEYTVRCDILDSTFQYLTFFQFADDFFLLLFQFSFNKSLVRNNHILEFLVDFNHLEFHSLAYEYIVVTDRFHINLRTRQECFNAEYVYNHTTLRAALDVTLDNFFVFKRSVYTVPRTSSASFLVRQDQLTFFVFLVFDVHFYSVTYFQIRIVTEFAQRNDTV